MIMLSWYSCLNIIKRSMLETPLLGLLSYFTLYYICHSTLTCVSTYLAIGNDVSYVIYSLFVVGGTSFSIDSDCIRG